MTSYSDEEVKEAIRRYTEDRWVGPKASDVLTWAAEQYLKQRAETVSTPNPVLVKS